MTRQQAELVLICAAELATPDRKTACMLTSGQLSRKRTRIDAAVRALRRLQGSLLTMRGSRTY